MTTLKELKELGSKATRAPWKVRRNQSTNKPACQITTQEKKGIVDMCRGDGGLSDAQLIATTRNALPDLIRVIELAGVALQQVNDKSLCVPAIVQDALSEIRKLKGK